jgi:hypothetical protein
MRKRRKKKCEWGRKKQENNQNEWGGQKTEKQVKKTQLVGREEKNQKKGFHEMAIEFNSFD